MRNPPCCVSLQKATKIIGIIHTVMLSLALLVLTVSLVVVAMNYSATNVPSTITLPSNTLSIFGLQNFSSTNFKTDDQGTISKDNLTIIQNGQVYYSEKYVVSQTVNQALSVIITAVILCTTQLVLSIQLWMGANNRNLWQCTIWFHVQIVNSVLSLLLLPIVIIVMIPDMQLYLLLASLFQTSLAFYILWVVYAFIKELGLEEDAGGRVEGEAFISNKQ